MLFVAPIAAAMLLQLGISRQREYQADASGARMVGQQYGLISALEKLGAYNKRIPMDISPSTSALCIVAPLNGRTDPLGPVQHASSTRGSHRCASQHAQSRDNWHSPWQMQRCFRIDRVLGPPRDYLNNWLVPELRIDPRSIKPRKNCRVLRDHTRMSSSQHEHLF